MNTEILDEYRRCAEICKNTDYGNKKSVKENNRAAKRMWQLTEKVVKEGSGAIRLLASLLDDPLTKEWLAYQLLEKADLDADTEDKCFSVIREIAASNIPVNSFAAKKYLDDRGRRIP